MAARRGEVTGVDVDPASVAPPPTVRLRQDGSGSVIIDADGRVTTAPRAARGW